MGTPFVISLLSRELKEDFHRKVGSYFWLIRYVSPN